MLAQDAHEDIEKGDSVEVKYYKTDGSKETPIGEEKNIEGTVTKTIENLGGGIHIEVTKGKISASKSILLHNVPGGTITDTDSYRTKRLGVKSRIRKINS